MLAELMSQYGYLVILVGATVQKILKENGFGPPDGSTRTWERFTSSAKDALWAIDYFVVRTLEGRLLQVLIVVDIHTRELFELRAFDGWDVDSVWTMRALARAMSRLKRLPIAVLHDPASVFAGQVARQLRVLEVDKCRTPPRLPAINGVAERTVKSVRFELLNHVRVTNVTQLQWYLDERVAHRPQRHESSNRRTSGRCRAPLPVMRTSWPLQHLAWPRGTAGDER